MDDNDVRNCNVANFVSVLQRHNFFIYLQPMTLYFRTSPTSHALKLKNFSAFFFTLSVMANKLFFIRTFVKMNTKYLVAVKISREFCGNRS